jgi:nucleoside-diphosphate-sugar epimerase
MRIFVAGATGVVGTRLVPILTKRGHQVTGVTRTPAKADRLSGQGANAVVVDALDHAAMKDAVAGAAPEVVVHELTAIPASLNLRRFDEDFGPTNRLRTEGTDGLIAAAQAAGVHRIVAQSYASWPYERRGGPIKSEDDPFDADPPAGMRRTLSALRHLETAVLGSGLEAVVLRYGAFYGPGSSLGTGSPLFELARKRRFPVVGSGAGIWSFVHVDDVAEATALAIERAAPGVYNVTDDEPAPVRDWLPALARAIGAPPPRTIPVWLARPLIGDAGVTMMTEIRGASNAKARRELDWTPRFATWRDGFRLGLG